MPGSFGAVGPLALPRLALVQHPAHVAAQDQRLGQGRNHQLEQKLGADVERLVRLDERAAHRDVLRVVVEEAVEPLVLHPELDGSPMLVATIRRLRHPRPAHEPRTHGDLDQLSSGLAHPVLGGDSRRLRPRCRLPSRCLMSWATTAPSSSGCSRRWRASTSDMAWSPRLAGRAATCPRCAGRGGVPHRARLVGAAPPALRRQRPAGAQLQPGRGPRLLRPAAGGDGHLLGVAAAPPWPC